MKKVLSYMLAFCMILGLMPIMAHAESGKNAYALTLRVENPEYGSAEVYVNGELKLEGAAESETIIVNDGDTIRVSLSSNTDRNGYVDAFEVNNENKLSDLVDYMYILTVSEETRISVSFTAPVYSITDDGSASFFGYSPSNLHKGDYITLQAYAEGRRVVQVMYSYLENGRTVTEHAVQDGEYWQFIMPGGDVVLSAETADAVYGLTARVADGEGSIAVFADGEEVHEAGMGDIISVMAEAAAGYALGRISVYTGDRETESTRIHRWIYTDQRQDAKETFVMPETDVTVEAFFTLYDYAVAVDNHTFDSCYTAKPDAYTHHAGDLVRMTIEPKEEYQVLSVHYRYMIADEVFISPAVYNNETGTWDFVMPAADVTVSGQVDNITYPVDIAASEGGTVTASTDAAAINGAVTLTPHPQEGYALFALTAEDAGGNPVEISADGVFLMPGSAVTVHADFRKLHAVSVAENASGTVTANVSSAVRGETVAITIADVSRSMTVTSVTVVSDQQTMAAALASGPTIDFYTQNYVWVYTFVMPDADAAVTVDIDQMIYRAEISAATPVMLNGDGISGYTGQQGLIYEIPKGTLVTAEYHYSSSYVPQDQETVEWVVFYTDDTGNHNIDIACADAAHKRITFTMPAADIYVGASYGYKYSDENGNMKACQDYTLLSAISDRPGATLANQWYVVDQDLTFNYRLTIVENVSLILCDGITLTMVEGIQLNNVGDNTLTIWGQKQGTGALKINMDKVPKNCAGIGGNEGTSAGTLNIHGGKISITNKNNGGAGIGGGKGGDGGTVNIYGGEVNCWLEKSIYDSITGEVNHIEGGQMGAAIGGGNGGNGGTVNIYGGIVAARGGSYGAGIGGCQEDDDGKGHGGNVNIYGGEVKAIGGMYSAGIGGASYGNGGTVTISGGTVTAQSYKEFKCGAGIGGGYCGHGGTVIISGGTVTALSVYGGAAIGSGNGYKGNAGTVIITGGNVTAKGGRDAAAIGGGEGSGGADVTISGGTVTAFNNTSSSVAPAAFGKGNDADENATAGTLTLYDTATVFAGSKQSQASRVSSDQRISSCMSSIYASISECGHVFGAWEKVDDETHARNCQYCLEKEVHLHTFGEDDRCTECGAEKPVRPEFSGCSLVLSGQIGVNFYMKIPEGQPLSRMRFTIGSRPSQAAGTAKDGLYTFTCYVNSIEMAEPITAEYSYTADGETKTLIETTSVKEYLEVIINNVNHLQEYDRATPLAKAIYNYGYYAGPALPGGMKHPAMPDVYAADTVLITSLSGYPISASLDTDVITAASYSLSLDSETAINFYLMTAQDLSKDDISVTADGQAAEFTMEKAGSAYRVTIAGIAAHQLGTVYTLTTGNTEISASAMSYVQQALSSSNVRQETKNAAAALYAYYQEAVSYLR